MSTQPPLSMSWADCLPPGLPYGTGTVRSPAESYAAGVVFHAGEPVRYRNLSIWMQPSVALQLVPLKRIARVISSGRWPCIRALAPARSVAGTPPR